MRKNTFIRNGSLENTKHEQLPWATGIENDLEYLALSGKILEVG